MLDASIRPDDMVTTLSLTNCQGQRVLANSRTRCSATNLRLATEVLVEVRDLALNEFLMLRLA